MEDQFNKLDELIKDDDKIVTVTSFASLANISCEEAQKVLNKYAEINKESKKIHMTYIIEGVKKNSENCSVVQVNDETLHDEKQLYKDDPPVTIFSIQKAKLIDYNVISLLESDPNTNTDALPGAIIGKNCVKRVLRKKTLPPLPATTIKGKCSIFMKQNSTAKSEVKATDQIEEKKGCNEDKIAKPKGNGQGSIASMFNKVTQDKKTDIKLEKPIQQKSKQNGGLSNFLSSQTKGTSKALGLNQIKQETLHVPKAENVELKLNTKPENNNGIKKESNKSDLFDSDSDVEVLKDLNIEDPKQETKSSIKEKSAKVVKNKTTQKKKRGKADIGNDRLVKKRKRIIVDEGSDSDDIFGSEKSDNEDIIIIEKSDEEPETVKVNTKILPPKNKRKKAVKRTYEDDEGYIVTQTEYVYETASEDENEPANKIMKTVEVKPQSEKKNSKKSKNEISPNKPTKSKKDSKKTAFGTQSTIMNFFKKQ